VAIEHQDLGAGEGKVCSKCDTYLPLSAYAMHSGGNFLRPECRKCNAELTVIRRKLRKVYGMPPEHYVCPICNQNAEQVKGKGNTKMVLGLLTTAMRPGSSGLALSQV
jgi:hypothetical protein